MQHHPLNFQCSPGFDLLYEHPDFIIINKFSGINMHIEHQQAGLCDYIKKQLNYPVYLCHRLDKATSGLMLLAKTTTANQQLSTLFAQRKVEKYYYAVGLGNAKKKQGLVKGDLLKTRQGNYKLAKTQQNPAITQFFSTHLATKQRLVILKPHTGKTHQLRVVMQSLGIPILGDARYSSLPSNYMHLHSSFLGFTYQGEAFNFTHLPEYGQFSLLTQLDKQWKKPQSLPWPSLKKTTI